MSYNLTRRSKVVTFDPGLTGGICFRSANHILAYPMPVIEKTANKKIKVELCIDRIVSFIWMNEPDVVGIELVHSMPKQGVASTFKFGEGYGILKGICGALRIPVILVSPTVWKKEMVGDYLELAKQWYEEETEHILKSGKSKKEITNLLKPYKNEHMKLKKYSSILYVESREYPVNLYPTENTKVKSDGIADAICIADFILKNVK